MIEGKVKEIKQKEKTYHLLILDDHTEMWVSGFDKSPYKEGDEVSLQLERNESGGNVYYNIIGEYELEDEDLEEADDKYHIIKTGHLTNQDWRLFKLSSQQATDVMLSKSIVLSDLTALGSRYKELTSSFFKWNQEMLK